MTQHPVFQMVIEQEGNGEYFLSFSLEHEDYYIQPCFVIPEVNEPTWQLKYYMPGELEGERVSFSLEFEYPLLVINDERLNYKVRFSLLRPSSGDPFETEYPFLNRAIEYKGQFASFVEPYRRFYLLSPIDLLVMDELFRQQKACFVGRTPAFNGEVG